jgi:hypothetical protein
MRLPYLLIFILAFTSCQQKAKEKSKNLTYFDLAGYFKNEAKRLSRINRPIGKTVWIDGKSEQKIIKIKDWEKELAVFIEADINKGSWKGAFKKSESYFMMLPTRYSSTSRHDTTITYTSNNEKIPIKTLKIVKQGNEVFSIQIFLHNINDLYTSQDSLIYFPDSLYEIKKVQRIKLMDEKKYIVKGEFKSN